MALLLGGWLALALAVGSSGRLEGLRPPLPQLMIAALTLATLVTFTAIPALRAWAGGVDLRLVMAFHLVRFVGFYFLALSRSGVLAPQFAVPAGWGDIVVAVGAVLLIVLAPPARPGSLPLIRIWNILGLIDILGVVLTAARVGESNPEGLRPLLRLPLSLLLTFVVPLIIASHVLIALRLGRASAGRAG